MNKSIDTLYFEKIGGCFETWMSDYDVSRRIALVTRLLPSDAASRMCLEVGCGTGRISRELAPRVRGLTVSDISGALAEKVGKALALPWSRADACKLHFGDSSFDLVVSSECIEHTPDPMRALSEMVRVLKPNGVLVVTTPNRLWYPLLMMSQWFRLRKFQGTEHWVWPRSAANTLTNLMVVDIKLSGCHLFPWQIPFAKRLLPFFDRYADSLFPVMINFSVCGTKANSV